MKTIILVRHSEPQRIAGIPNDKIPLSEAGRILAKDFFTQKIFESPQCVYSFPFLRAMETTSFLSEKFVVDERLKERALGDLESLDAAFWACTEDPELVRGRSGCAPVPRRGAMPYWKKAGPVRCTYLMA